MATIVFSKVGFSVWFAIGSTSLISSAMPCSSAGWKCSSLILSNGGRLNGSLLSVRSGLAAAAVTSGFLLVSLGDEDGEGFAARQGGIMAQPKRTTLRQAKRTRTEANDGLRFCIDFEMRIGRSLRGREADRSLKQSRLEAQAAVGTPPAKQDADKPHVAIVFSIVLHEPI